MLSTVHFSTEYAHDELFIFSEVGIMYFNYEIKRTISLIQHSNKKCRTLSTRCNMRQDGDGFLRIEY